MEEISKPYSKLEWLLYIIILPLIFFVLLTGILVQFSGYDVVDKVLVAGNKVPGLATFLPDPKENMADEVEETESLGVKLQEAEASVKESETMVDDLKEIITNKEVEITQLQKNIKNLEVDLEKKLETDAERKEKLVELAQLYGGMSPSKSAPILAEFTPLEAAGFLELMSQSQRTAIMAKFPPEIAARFTVALKEKNEAEDPEIAALQQRIQALTNEILTLTSGTKESVSMTELANTYGQMPPKQAATVLSEMSKSNSEFQHALRILANMNDANRSRIMAEMTIDMAKKYTNELAKK